MPPPIALADVPTDGIEPLCAVAAVVTAYALGAASPTSTAAATPATATRRSRPAGTRQATATTPAASTTHRTHANASSDGASRTNAQAAVAAAASACVRRPTTPARCRQNATTPTPTNAAIPGASATV